jgi:very-short-patch-repair endonuclease
MKHSKDASNLRQIKTELEAAVLALLCFGWRKSLGLNRQGGMASVIWGFVTETKN